MWAGHGGVNQLVLSLAQPFYICFGEMGTYPQCLIGDDSVFVEYQLVDFFSKPFIILYKVEYLSDIFNVYTFG
jgi:hypothetical protein